MPQRRTMYPPKGTPPVKLSITHISPLCIAGAKMQILESDESVVIPY